MTEKHSPPVASETLLAKAGRLLIAAWMVGVLAAYLQRLFARVLDMAGASR